MEHFGLTYRNPRIETYLDGTPALVADVLDTDLDCWFDETLSTNLFSYGLMPDEDCIFVKDYSEHEGLAEAIEDAGWGEAVGAVMFGPFNATATVIRLSEEIVHA